MSVVGMAHDMLISSHNKGKWKVGGSSLFLQRTGKVYFCHTVAVNIVYSRIVGRTPWLSGNSSSFHSWTFPTGVTRKLTLFMSRPTSYWWEKLSKCQWGPVYSIHFCLMIETWGWLCWQQRSADWVAISPLPAPPPIPLGPLTGSAVSIVWCQWFTKWSCILP